MFTGNKCVPDGERLITMADSSGSMLNLIIFSSSGSVHSHTHNGFNSLSNDANRTRILANEFNSLNILQF